MSQSQNHPLTPTPTVCLNMIVKNESAILPRLFDSVVSIIDCYCICDTGSTDSTVDVIQSYFEAKGIPGKVITEPFQNFEYNRNVALQACIGMSDFVLLLDADMVLDIKLFDKKLLLLADCFTLVQGTPHFYYQNMRILRNDGRYKYVGVTHEYIDKPADAVVGHIEKDLLFIRDIGDGGSKQDKFDRDIQLLLGGLQEDPSNDRYHFYLANSYYDLGRFEEAIPVYQKRIQLGGWREEVWYSYYRIGLCFMKLNKIPEAMWHWMEGFNYYPERLEGMYELIRHYRLRGQNKVAFGLYTMCKPFLESSINRDKFLFLHNEVYNYKLYFEYTIIANYNSVPDIQREAMAVLNSPLAHPAEIDNLLSNLKFYQPLLEPNFVVNYDKRIKSSFKDEVFTLYSSSSSLVPLVDEDHENRKHFGKPCYAMNVRFVNYFIEPNGTYANCDNHIVTINKYMELGADFKVVREEMIHVTFDDRRYIGVEDVRLFHDVNGNLLAAGTALHKNGNLGVVVGKYTTETKGDTTTRAVQPIWRELTQGFEPPRACEKNWVFVNCCIESDALRNAREAKPTLAEGSTAMQALTETYMVYDWYPLRLCKEDTNQCLQVVATRPMPRLFERVRGSTCGFEYEDEIWFVTHLVSHETPRQYYHVLCVFDIEMNLLRYSEPFKFEGHPIEYCLSIVVESKCVLINYSTWDRTTRIGVYNKWELENKMRFRVPRKGHP